MIVRITRVKVGHRQAPNKAKPLVACGRGFLLFKHAYLNSVIDPGKNEKSWCEMDQRRPSV